MSIDRRLSTFLQLSNYLSTFMIFFFFFGNACGFELKGQQKGTFVFYSIVIV